MDNKQTRPMGQRRAARIARRIAKYGDGPVPTEKKYPGRRAPSGLRGHYSPSSDRYAYLNYGHVFPKGSGTW